MYTKICQNGKNVHDQISKPQKAMIYKWFVFCYVFLTHSKIALNNQSKGNVILYFKRQYWMCILFGLGSLDSVLEEDVMGIYEPKAMVPSHTIKSNLITSND